MTPEGKPVDTFYIGQTVPQDIEDQLALARRLIVDRCLYGVDKNPMAVEMAKLSMWLVTMKRNEPFTFLDHTLKCGDSLLGLTSPEQIEKFHINPDEGKFFDLYFRYSDLCKPAVKEALELRKRMKDFYINSAYDFEQKWKLHAREQAALKKVGYIADLITAAALYTSEKGRGSLNEEIQKAGKMLKNQFNQVEIDADVINKIISDKLNTGNPSSLPRKTFHWVLEFPEIFAADDHSKRGFDAIVGNPPFQGGQKITGALGTDYRNFLISYIAGDTKGSADICSYFFLRAVSLLLKDGMLGYLATNTIAQGDTREVGLDRITDEGSHIIRAVPSRKWPGQASLEVAHIWIRKGSWKNRFFLEDKAVKSITSFLAPPGKTLGKPFRLKSNEDKAFQGSIVLGMGFVLEPDEAEALIKRNPQNKDVLFPYLNGKDLNSRFDQSPSRWVINFFDWPLKRANVGIWKDANKKQRKEWLQEGIVPLDYPDPVAYDYLEIISIVEGQVKPERQRLNTNGSFALRKPLPQKFWIYAEKRPKLYQSIKYMKNVLALTRISKYLIFSFIKNHIIIDGSSIVIADDSFAHFGILQSSFHVCWTEKYQSSLETRGRYTSDTCFETFSFPKKECLSTVEEKGIVYHNHRQSIMETRKEGLTDTYNRFHNPKETSPDIQKLRELHAEMDYAVAKAYGWDDLQLCHDFYETPQGTRHTISEEARREVLDRLLDLNHQRYAEEAAAGLHDKKKSGKPAKTAGRQKTKTEEVEELKFL